MRGLSRGRIDGVEATWSHDDAIEGEDAAKRTAQTVINPRGLYLRFSDLGSIPTTGSRRWRTERALSRA
jgi:hypothetical protein